MICFLKLDLIVVGFKIIVCRLIHYIILLFWLIKWIVLWRNKENRRQFFLDFANEHQFNPFVSDNWHSQPVELISSRKVVSFLLFNFLVFLILLYVNRKPSKYWCTMKEVCLKHLQLCFLILALISLSLFPSDTILLKIYVFYCTIIFIIFNILLFHDWRCNFF